MKEILAIPDEHLEEVIRIIRTGILNTDVSDDVRFNLMQWCDEMEEYLNSDEEDTNE